MLLRVNSLRFQFARAAFYKFSDCLVSRRISPSLIPNTRSFVRNGTNLSSEHFGNKCFYLVTAGWFLALLEALRRSKVSLVTNIQASTTSIPHNSKPWNFIADVVEKTAPAVVYIEIVGKLV